MKILTHICCGPCLVYPYEKMIREGEHLTGFWYNPNIHPFTEYRERLKSLRKFQDMKGMDIIYQDSYDLERFLQAAMSDLQDRCMHCYILRLTEAAGYAKANGFEYFTTTLLVSPYQKLDYIRKVGNDLEIETGVKFLDLDIVSGYREGREKAREMGLYMQKYCGCVFSEKERYQQKQKKKKKKKTAAHISAK
ncbi:MAG: epoxyqueuosine reductase QueH [candidate division Zixibacteria bacterium]|nr:epoxyqueuosine reductase QueH [candidate division Zixibacteria bacterium]NIR67071.1 epoxyqueuosine reductase QueH [candidate division Zixibacteria bacterium]NIS18095.1 epoxyqueuosine reductase QueH [candidate division Zixibacteria bacterium]NIS48482.1 epoxyqueuosine reductase QueH [candidate division Zixibacteria bacterium]NIT54380.1 epoxyqueuosine reductase QueH [candidate division Zixibacteria bacterium]